MNAAVYLKSASGPDTTLTAIHFEHCTEALQFHIIKPEDTLEEMRITECSAVTDWTLRLASVATDLSTLKRLEVVECTDGGQYLDARFLISDIVLFCPNLRHLKLDGTCRPDALDFQRIVQRLKSLQTISFTPKNADFLFETDSAIMCDPGDVSHLKLGRKLQRAVQRLHRFKMKNPDYLVRAREVAAGLDDRSSTDEVDSDDSCDIQFPMD